MCAQNIVKPDAEGLAQAASRAARGGLPPVEQWNPPFCGNIDMRIARDGTWYHEGTPIGRPALVRLFSTILWREGDAYFLITPAEKVGIQVDDAPFLAVDFEVTGEGPAQSLHFTTLTGDKMTAGPDNPIRVSRDADSDEPAPYIRVRRNLDALIDRKSFYRLVDLGVQGEYDGAEWFGLWSGGVFFPMIPSGELPG
jgi:hypothetical protein